MKQQTFKVLGLPLVTMVPETVEEFDALAKKPGACLNEAINNVAYRGVFAEARDIFCELFEQATGIERLTKPSGRKKKNDQGVEEDVLVYAESEGEYIRRALGVLAQQQNVEEVPITSPEFATIMSRLSVGGDKEVKFDPSATATSRGPQKLAKMWLEAATVQIINPGLAPQWVAKYGGDETPECIGRKLKELHEAQLNAAKFLQGGEQQPAPAVEEQPTEA